MFHPGHTGVALTAEEAMTLGVIVCANCGAPPNNHFDDGLCAHSRARGTSWERRLRYGAPIEPTTTDPVSILRGAMREYHDAATSALIAYRPEDPNGDAQFCRYLALDHAAKEIHGIVVAVAQAEPGIAATECIDRRLGYACGLYGSQRAALWDDLLLRLCGETGAIGECFR